MHLPGSALEGGAVFEGEGQAAICVGRGVIQQAAFHHRDVVDLFPEGVSVKFGKVHQASGLALTMFAQQLADALALRIEGIQLRVQGIQSGDILVVDKSLEARDGCIIIAELDGEFLVKQFCRWKDGTTWLVPANPQFQTINVTNRPDFNIWGVVTAYIHQFVHERIRK